MAAVPAAARVVLRIGASLHSRILQEHVFAFGCSVQLVDNEFIGRAVGDASLAVEVHLKRIAVFYQRVAHAMGHRNRHQAVALTPGQGSQMWSSIIHENLI